MPSLFDSIKQMLSPPPQNAYRPLSEGGPNVRPELERLLEPEYRNNTSSDQPGLNPVYRSDSRPDDWVQSTYVPFRTHAVPRQQRKERPAVWNRCKLPEREELPELTEEQKLRLLPLVERKKVELQRRREKAQAKAQAKAQKTAPPSSDIAKNQIASTSKQESQLTRTAVDLDAERSVEGKSKGKSKLKSDTP